MHARHRWISWLALLGLMFQQCAMAAYVCPLEPARMVAVEQMQANGDEDCRAMTTPDPVRCQQHCNPQQADTPPSPVTDVPPSLLPHVVPALVATVAAMAIVPDRQRAVALRATSPPLAIRYCSFQF